MNLGNLLGNLRAKWQTPAEYVRSIKNKRKVYKTLSVILGISAVFYYIPLVAAIYELHDLLLMYPAYFNYTGLAMRLASSVGTVVFVHSAVISALVITVVAIVYAKYIAKPAADKKVGKLDKKTRDYFERAHKVAISAADMTELEQDLRSKIKPKKITFVDYIVDVFSSGGNAYTLFLNITPIILNIGVLVTPLNMLVTFSMAYFIPITIVFVLSWVMLSTAHSILEREIKADKKVLKKFCHTLGGFNAHLEVQHLEHPISTEEKKRRSERFMILFAIYKDSKTSQVDLEDDLTSYASLDVQAYKHAASTQPE